MFRGNLCDENFGKRSDLVAKQFPHNFFVKYYYKQIRKDQAKLFVKK